MTDSGEQQHFGYALDYADRYFGLNDHASGISVRIGIIKRMFDPFERDFDSVNFEAPMAKVSELLNEAAQPGVTATPWQLAEVQKTFAALTGWLHAQHGQLNDGFGRLNEARNAVKFVREMFDDDNRCFASEPESALTASFAAFQADIIAIADYIQLPLDDLQNDWSIISGYLNDVISHVDALATGAGSDILQSINVAATLKMWKDLTTHAVAVRPLDKYDMPEVPALFR